MSIPEPMHPAQNLRKKRRKWPWVAGAVVAILLIAGIVGGQGDRKQESLAAATVTVSTTTAPVTTTDPAKAAAAAAEAQASREKKAAEDAEAARTAGEAAEAQRKADEEAARKANEITYSVTTTGPGILSVTYMKPNFNIAQETNVKGKKWSKTIQDDGSSIGINMNAQNKGGGTITCTISRGGQVIAENSSSGEYAVVTCM